MILREIAGPAAAAASGWGAAPPKAEAIAGLEGASVRGGLATERFGLHARGDHPIANIPCAASRPAWVESPPAPSANTHRPNRSRRGSREDKPSTA